MSALCACLWSHFYYPVGFLQNLSVVVDQYHGISVGYQVVHYSGKSHDV